MEYSIAGKDNDTRKFKGKWMEIEKVILSDITQTEKKKTNIVCSHS